MLLEVVLAQSLAGAWPAGRPVECGEEGGRSANVWERAKSPELRRYCDLLASASSKLAGTAAMAEVALGVAREADGILPGRGAPRVLEGRALAALGKLNEAWQALRDARTRDARSLDDPPALLAWARVLARTGHADDASEAYRALLPRASSLSNAERTSAAFEAGLVAMARGPAGLADAAPALREALREAPQNELEDIVVLALALALERGGAGEEARALLSERSRGDPRGVVKAWRARDALSVAPAETPALVALALEATDAAGARDAWQAYLEGAPKGPWVLQTRSHIASLRGKRATARGER